jgi:hypothetical protein
MPREALNTKASKPGVRIGNVGRRDPVQDVVGRVAEHALGADVEDLDHALLVGGHAREIGAVENRVLQGPGFEHGLLAPDVSDKSPGADRETDGGGTGMSGGRHGKKS